MEDRTREQTIVQLDELARKVGKLREEIEQITGANTAPIESAVYVLTREIVSTSVHLKKSNRDRIESYITNWHLFRIDDEDGEESVNIPDIESIEYTGNDTWIIVMATLTHGRERIVVHSDAATWEQVYSADKEQEAQ